MSHIHYDHLDVDYGFLQAYRVPSYCYRNKLPQQMLRCLPYFRILNLLSL